MTLRTFGWNEFGFLLTALQWTVLLTIIALIGGGIVGFFIALARTSGWIAQLNEIEALKPATVVPGHMTAGSALNASAIRYTRNYLQRFDAEAAKAKTGAELIRAMTKAYPKAGEVMALDIGAKVNKGEMKW